jgi:hypothetical protein
VVRTEELTIDDVVRAGRVLFGPAFAAETRGWREALKETYRRRAMETHPDRARVLARPERDLAREFEAVSDAYRVLAALDGGPPATGGARRAAAAPPPRAPRRAAAPGEGAEVHVRAPRAASRAGAEPPRVRVAVRAEDLPRRKLRFAEYLYYSGRVRWTDLVDAIAWQRAQRPPLGRIAVEFGFLGPDQVGVILERRREAAAHAIPFGEWAVRLGYLTQFQLLAALGQQLRRQRPIGEWFVERGIVGPDEIDAIRRRILRHNAPFQG